MIVAHRFEVVGDDAVMHPRQQAFHPPQYPALTGIDKFHAFLKGVQRHHFLIEITDCLTGFGVQVKWFNRCDQPS